MSRAITYFFSLVSPWAYIGHAPFADLVRRHSLTVDYRPVTLALVFADTGGLPLAKRHPARQRYRMLELQRWRVKRGLPLDLHPKHWPFNTKLADQLVVALAVAGRDPSEFMRLAFTACWEQNRNLADEGVLAELLAAAGHEAPALLEAAKSEAIDERYAQNAQDAIAVDAFGSPVYVLDGEAFWGQDRLELLDDALTSGRAAFRPDA
jgi:2-hydroxychromene-2-carboxylate isomerase